MLAFYMNARIKAARRVAAAALDWGFFGVRWCMLFYVLDDCHFEVAAVHRYFPWIYAWVDMRGVFSILCMCQCVVFQAIIYNTCESLSGRNTHPHTHTQAWPKNKAPCHRNSTSMRFWAPKGLECVLCARQVPSML